MTNKNLLSGRDKELQEFAEQYDDAMANNKPFYLDADDMAELADWFGVKRKFDKAFEIAHYGLELHPDSTTLKTELAYLYLDDGQKDNARQIIEGISDNYSSEVKVVRAHLLLSEGKIEEAEQELETIEDKEDLSNMIDVSYMYLDMGYPEKALKWLKPGINKYAEDEAYIAVTADSYYAKGTVEKAIPLYNKLLDQNPYSAPYWFGLGRCYFEQRKYDKTIDACDYALVSDDEFSDAYLMKGHSFYQLGNEESALECYQQAEKLDAVSPDFIYTFIGLYKVNKGEWKAGYENLEKAIQLTEGDEHSLTRSHLYANAGLCLSKMGKKRKSHQYCKKAHLLSPEEPDSHLIEGRIYMEEGQYEKGIKAWEKALKCSPVADTWNEIGMHSMEIGHLDYAKLAFEQVSKLEPTFEGINEKLTVTYFSLHDKENFMKYNQKCVNPLKMDDLEQMKNALKNENREELAEYIQNILKALK